MKNLNNHYSFKFILLLIFSLNGFKINSYLLFPLDYIQDKNYKFFNLKDSSNKPEDIIKGIFYKNLITKLKIGTQPQILSFLIRTNDDKFQLTSINPSNSSNNTILKDINFYNFTEKDIYNESLSSSYKEDKCEKVFQLLYH